MNLLNVLLQLPNITWNGRRTMFYYYLKKILTLKVSKKEANLKKLVICTKKGNGQITGVSDNEYKGYVRHFDKKISFSLRNEIFSDVGILYEFIVQGEYNKLFALARQKYSPDHQLNIIDAGGNIGLFSIFAMSNFPKCQIAYIEPDNEAKLQFEKLLKLNKRKSPFIFANGLANDPENNILLDHGPRGQGNAGFVTRKSSKFTGLTTTSLEEIFKKCEFNEVNILKIDIEGSEEEVILGNNFNQELASRIEIVAIEIHDDQVDRKKIEAKLFSLGFEKILSERVDIFKNKYK